MERRELEEVYRRYYPVIRAKSARILRDAAEAEDVAQETFRRLWASRGKLRDPQAALAWIYRVATRIAVDRIRHGKIAAAALPPGLGSSVDGGARLAAREELRSALRRFGRRDLEVLVLSRVDGLTQQEIGEVLQTSDRTVRRILQRLDQSLASTGRVR